MLSVFDQGAHPPCPSSFNLAAHVLGLSELHAEKVALSVVGLSDAQDWTYSKLKAAVLGTGAGFLNAGLKPGDKVLMRLGNTIEFPIAYLGAIAVGLVPIPTSSQLTEPEVANIIQETHPALILRDPTLACPVTNIQSVDPKALQDMWFLPPAKWQLGDPNRLAYIIYTSGTSGVPRAVMHAHRAIWARQMMFKGWYDIGDTDRLMHAGAFNWTYTLGTGLMDPWTVGATALIPADGVTPDRFPEIMKQNEVTIFAAAPGVYRKILKLPEKLILPKLRHGISAGEKMSPELHERWTAKTSTQVFEAFGMSEVSTFISSSPVNPTSPENLGRPQTGRHVAVIDQGVPVTMNTEGTIALHRSDPGLMLGYLNAPEATAARMSGEWFLTGDRGAMDADGQITYLGRVDDMMNAGGYRVSPIEVETALMGHVGITQCAVVDIEVRKDARLIMGFYTGPTPLEPSELDDYAKSRLAGYKCPRGYFHVDALPTGPNGKLLRRALRPIYEALNGQA